MYAVSVTPTISSDRNSFACYTVTLCLHEFHRSLNVASMNNTRPSGLAGR